jgi:NADH:ubiquinone reductase (H+-translocating)
MNGYPKKRRLRVQRILVLGAGFADLWSAVAAARRLGELGAGDVVNRTAWHSIRVRNYESDLDATRVPLADVLERKVVCTTDGASHILAYDRLVLALASAQQISGRKRAASFAFGA